MESRRRCYGLSATSLEVAGLFAAENFSGDELLASQTVLRLIRDGRYSEMKSFLGEFTRPMFQSFESYYRRKQFAALVQKVPFKGSTVLRKQAALHSFHKSEELCRRTNKRLRHYCKHPDRMPNDVRVILSRSRELIRRVLGDLTDSKLEFILSSARPGSGVCIGTMNKHRVSRPYKLGDTSLCVSDDARCYARLLVETSPSWFRLHAEVDWGRLGYTVPYVSSNFNRLTFVEKDACTLRTIAIEPNLNVCLQLGVHSFIASQLQKFGNSITDQSRNQELARVGSERGILGPCTIDLSSASDTVSTELVRYLLPSVWFSFLDDIRCKAGVVEGINVNYEKFSSMGNGFTFALETLIFWAIAKTVTDYCGANTDYLSVYGDDIIVAGECYAILVEVLQFCGFVINTDKSFAVGPFRESCGADWHGGFRVTPLYLRSENISVPDVHRFLNGIDPVFRVNKIRTYLLGLYKSESGKLIFGLPNEDLSSCLFTTLAYAKGIGAAVWDSYIQCWKFRVLTQTAVKEKVPPLYGLAAALMGPSKSGNYGPLRGRIVFSFRWSTQGIPPGLPRVLRE